MFVVISTIATAVFTGITAYLMYAQKMLRQTPEIKLRFDDPSTTSNFYKLTLTFIPASEDYEIFKIGVSGCDVSETFTSAEFGLPPVDNEALVWRKFVYAPKIIPSEENAVAYKKNGEFAPFRPAICFKINPRKPLKSLTVHVYPRLVDRLLFRQRVIRKRLIPEKVVRRI